MANTRTPAWRNRITEACATVARAISHTEGGMAHTVQLMLQNPAARDEACRDALRRTKPLDNDKGGVSEYQRLQTAVDLLRGYAGRAL